MISRSTSLPPVSAKKLAENGGKVYSTLRNRKPMKRRNTKRRQSEFARCYHARARVAFVKSLPCVFCAALHPALGIVSAGKSDNAHTVTDGMGRKAGYETIVPLCRSHHRMYDEHRAPLDDKRIRAAIAAQAYEVERRWQLRAEDAA